MKQRMKEPYEKGLAGLHPKNETRDYRVEKSLEEEDLMTS
jgi:hypothetical protein